MGADLPVAVPPKAYEAGDRAASAVAPGAAKSPVRAAVEAVWPLAVAEGRRLERAEHAPEHKAEITAVVRELVALACDPDGPTAEWLDLVRSVAEGHYTPPDERAAHE